MLWTRALYCHQHLVSSIWPIQGLKWNLIVALICSPWWQVWLIICSYFHCPFLFLLWNACSFLPVFLISCLFLGILRGPFHMLDNQPCVPPFVFVWCLLIVLVFHSVLTNHHEVSSSTDTNPLSCSWRHAVPSGGRTKAPICLPVVKWGPFLASRGCLFPGSWPPSSNCKASDGGRASTAPDTKSPPPSREKFSNVKGSCD